MNQNAPSKKRLPRVLVLGSGIAGLSVALKLAHAAKVTLISKSRAEEGATRYAQGGIASVWAKGDSFEDHIQDTLAAGAGLCHLEVADLCVRKGPECIRELIEYGVPFTRLSEETQRVPLDPAEVFDLHREGGHGRRRILHVDDSTGVAIQTALISQVQANPNIEILEKHIAMDLITQSKLRGDHEGGSGSCMGAYVLNIESGEVIPMSAEITVLATGGAGKVYLYTSNPDVATGDGVAIAARAGARISNMEFMQFHPTCLFHPEAKNFLISEALRGEGAVLKTVSGEEFMNRYHSMGSLAPRDIVARSIDQELKRTGDERVYLDATHLPPETLKRKFPNIYQTCLRFGIDMTEQPIPVVPAAHYTCGGVWVDIDGQTSIHGLYAVGETAATGLHGANRLASNSLLEAVVFADQVATHALQGLKNYQEKIQESSPQRLPQWNTGEAVEVEEQIDIAAAWMEIRTLMWNYVGIVRSNRRLAHAERRLALIHAEVNQYYWQYLPNKNLIELRNILTVAELIVKAAKWRKESRGLHYTVDYPKKDDRFYLKDTIF
jgi:L-aspartate oxidase